jgi:hypothetical protein
MNRVCGPADGVDVCLAFFAGDAFVPGDARPCVAGQCGFGFACVNNPDLGVDVCVEECTPGSGGAVAFVTDAEALAFQRAVDAAFAARP